MNKEFMNIFLVNLLIVIVLVPMVIILNVIMMFFPNIIFWIIVGVGLLLLISYISYSLRKQPVMTCEECKRRGKAEWEKEQKSFLKKKLP